MSFPFPSEHACRRRALTIDSTSSPMATDTWTIFSVPPELRRMIWDAVLEDCRIWVRPISDRPGQVVNRRFMSADAPQLYPSILRYPRHPLEFIHSFIHYEFRLSLIRWHHPTLVLGPTHLIPASVFTGVLHLSIEMRQAMFTLQVTLPLIPTPYNANPPNSHLVLTNAPRLQLLDIYWRIPYDNPDFGIYRTTFQVGLARLAYFNRSFRAIVRWSSSRRGIMRASGTLLDTQTVTNHVPGIDANYNAYGLDHTDEYTNLRNTLRYMTQNLLHGPNNGLLLHAYMVITEAHPWYDHVPLGYLTGAPGLPQASISAARTTRRPYDP